MLTLLSVRNTSNKSVYCGYRNKSHLWWWAWSLRLPLFCPLFSNSNQSQPKSVSSEGYCLVRITSVNRMLRHMQEHVAVMPERGNTIAWGFVRGTSSVTAAHWQVQ
jgi:hypothetical protein